MDCLPTHLSPIVTCLQTFMKKRNFLSQEFLVLNFRLPKDYLCNNCLIGNSDLLQFKLNILE